MSSVTIKDIAREAKVSVATVSRALNHASCVTDAMQERVIAAANKLGYVPNSVAKSLKTNSTHTIGVVLSDISNPDYISITRTIEDVVGKEDYSLIMCSTGNQKNRELNYLQMLFSKNIDALILNTTELNNDFVLKMSERIPILLLNRPINDSAFKGDFITTDSYMGTYMLTKQLLSLGHRRIYVIQGPPQLTNNKERFQAFLDAMQEAGNPVDKDYPYIYTGEFTPQSGVEAVKKLWEMDPLPTAILTLSNMSMLGVLREIRRGPYNIQIPEDISLATYDSLPNMELLSIRPTTAQFDNVAIGLKCARTILERIKDPTLLNRKFLFEPTIISGNSVGLPRPENALNI